MLPICLLLLACLAFSLASNLFPMTFECLPRVLLFVRCVLDFIFVIARQNPIPDIVSLRIGEIIGFAKNGAPNPCFLKKEGSEHTFKWEPSFAQRKVSLRLLAKVKTFLSTLLACLGFD